jgi:hypothetical protein
MGTSGRGGGTFVRLSLVIGGLTISGITVGFGERPKIVEESIWSLSQEESEENREGKISLILPVSEGGDSCSSGDSK